MRNSAESMVHMKKLTKYSRAAQYLEKIFKMLNDEYFESELSIPVITIQSTPNAYGHVTVGKVWKKSDDSEEYAYELNIGAGTLNRHIENVCGTMVHEMVHIYCMEHGIKDVSRGGTYHNKKFRDEATKRGLIIDYDPRIGFSITTPADELLQFVLDTGLEDIKIGRMEFCFGSLGIAGTGTNNKGGPDGETSKPPKKKSSTRKYKCPSCGCSVRATKKVNIICADCNEVMVCEDDEE